MPPFGDKWTACPAVGTQWPEGNEKEGGLVKFEWIWQQDAASAGAFPDCDGPVQQIQVENASATPYFVHLPNTRLGAVQIQINPGYAKIITPTSTPVNTADLGLTNRVDCLGVIVTHVSDPNLRNIVAR